MLTRGSIVFFFFARLYSMTLWRVFGSVVVIFNIYRMNDIRFARICTTYAFKLKPDEILQIFFIAFCTSNSFVSYAYFVSWSFARQHWNTCIFLKFMFLFCTFSPGFQKQTKFMKTIAANLLCIGYNKCINRY